MKNYYESPASGRTDGQACLAGCADICRQDGMSAGDAAGRPKSANTVGDCGSAKSAEQAAFMRRGAARSTAWEFTLNLMHLLKYKEIH